MRSYKVKQIARLLEVNAATVRRYIKEGIRRADGKFIKLEAYKIGNSKNSPIRITQRAYERFMDKCSEGSN
jgi:predicted transcriptional regulator